MPVLDGKFHQPEPKHKACACGCRLFKRQGESVEEYEARALCPRCAANKREKGA